MSAITVVLLLAATLTTAVSGVALATAWRLRRRLAALQRQLAGGGGDVREEVRTVVVETLAEERERELAEARAYWAEHEARSTDGDVPLLAGRGTEYEIAPLDNALLDTLLGEEDGADGYVFVPRQPEAADVDRADRPRPDAQVPEPAEDGRPAADEQHGGGAGVPEPADDDRRDAAELAAARRGGPTQLGPVPRPGTGGLPVLDEERTVRRLAELAAARTPLTDVRPGPLGALDVYVFADGTAVCLSPGHEETAQRLVDALRAGIAPELLGGSGVAGSFALTFACGEDTVFVLADQVVATA